jgi:hypothetical protein
MPVCRAGPQRALPRREESSTENSHQFCAPELAKMQTICTIGRQTFDTSLCEVYALQAGHPMSTTLSPRAVLLTMLFIVVSLISQAITYCTHLFNA